MSNLFVICGDPDTICADIKDENVLCYKDVITHRFVNAARRVLKDAGAVYGISHYHNDWTEDDGLKTTENEWEGGLVLCDRNACRPVGFLRKRAEAHGLRAKEKILQKISEDPIGAVCCLDA